MNGLTQEFEAKFENQSHGIVYHEFDRSENLRDAAWRRGETLYLALDFNVSPMTAVVCRIEDQSSPRDWLYGPRPKILQVLAEIVLPDSNTPEMCEALVNLVRSWGPPPYTVRIYGDAANAARSTSGQSDYVIIRQCFGAEPGFQATYHNRRSNPPVRDRVGAVNAMLRNTKGERRLLIDPQCKVLIRDFECVSWKVDAHDNLLQQLDKTKSELTHISDALGYLINAEFPLLQMGGPKSNPLC